MGNVQKLTLILFKLPDGRLILQRRTKDAPYGAGLLGIFGGWVEEDETVEECLFREIQEETSLDIKNVQPKALTDFVIKASEDFDKDRHFYIFEAAVPSMEFKVYEGDGAEAYSADEIRKRTDLTGSAQYTFSHVL